MSMLLWRMGFNGIGLSFISFTCNFFDKIPRLVIKLSGELILFILGDEMSGLRKN
jgi:hypothetical protein